MIKKLPHEANLLRAAVFVLLLYDRIRKIYIYTFEPYEIETHFFMKLNLRNIFYLIFNPRTREGCDILADVTVGDIKFPFQSTHP